MSLATKDRSISGGQAPIATSGLTSADSILLSAFVVFVLDGKVDP